MPTVSTEKIKHIIMHNVLYEKMYWIFLL